VPDAPCLPTVLVVGTENLTHCVIRGTDPKLPWKERDAELQEAQLYCRWLLKALEAERHSIVPR